MADPEVKAALQDPILAMAVEQFKPTLQMVLDGSVDPNDVIPGIKQQLQNQPNLMNFMLKLVDKVNSGGTNGMGLRP